VVVTVAFLALTGTGHVIDAATQHFMLYYAGVFALLALCASVALGLVATDRMFLHPGHRILVQAAHRAASFGAVTFLLIHIVTEILAQRAHILDAVVPFLSPFRTFYIGLGTIASDLVLLLVITGIMRKRFTAHGQAWRWRAMHYTSYFAFLFGVWHGLLGGRAGKAYVDWSYGFVVALVALGLAVRILANSMRPKESLSAPPVPETASSGTAPMRAASMFAQLGVVRAMTSATVLAQSAPQPMLSAPVDGWTFGQEAYPEPAYAALPAATASYMNTPYAGPDYPDDGRQPFYEPGYEGPPRYMGAPRRASTGPIPRAAAGPAPRAVGQLPQAPAGPATGRNSGPMPRAATGPIPAAVNGPPRVRDSGPMPRATTGPMPRAGNGPAVGRNSGPMPRAATGPMPQAPAGPPMGRNSGPMPRAATGPMPQAPAGPAMGRNHGPMPRAAAGPMPQAVNRPAWGPGGGPMPAANSGPMPRPGSGPVQRAQAGPMPAAGQPPRPGPGPRPSMGGPLPRSRSGPAPSAGYGHVQGPGAATPPAGHRPAQPASPGWGATAWAGMAGQADWAGQTEWAGSPDNATVWDVDTSAGNWDSSAGNWDSSAGNWDSSGGNWDYGQPPWDGGAPEPDPGFRYRQPGPGMPGYRRAADRFSGGDLR